MPKRIENLHAFLSDFASLLTIVEQCGPVLFWVGFRKNLAQALPEVTRRLTDPDPEWSFYLESPDDLPEMRQAGLAGAQLALKLDSYAQARNAFDEQGTAELLEEALEKGGVMLGSLAGALPGFGSFAQELVDFLLKELKKRWRFWKHRRPYPDGS